ncbi:ABC transporter ATP-binding protein [Acuticoccus mangrovi]|uniref:ABC transporter ATP-binding protein n=1 Tax=Acuticoccus mangrovi TaxID=2796142 RepID=A0A934MLZ1_9HYPH|nr:ABC transporter ATP-binding protein [Acuticoccus mangrovi]MBJ3776804.1 ABC transporter ATP-binding protein [Acuticoccus mangrovi]
MTTTIDPHDAVLEPATDDSGFILDVRELCVAIRGKRVVDGVSLAVRPHEILALVGESGCGKSVTSLAVMNLLATGAEVAGGSVTFRGRSVYEFPPSGPEALNGNRIAMIFQDPMGSLNPLMQVGPQIAEALLVHRSAAGRGRGRRELKRWARQRALEIMDQVGIPDPARRYRQYPFELSGGMCQRIVIAMAIICHPDLLLADEPTTALDVTIQAQILDLLKRLREEVGSAIVLVTHDMGVVAETADRVAVMYAGRVVETGLVTEVFLSPRHPYTRLLLETMRALENGTPKGRLSTISGAVPDARHWGEGCRFASRCPKVMERCHKERPPETGDDRSSGHRWACWLNDGRGEMGDIGRGA